jgi:transcriptional regulator with XRE-family HTH domain
MKRKKQKFNLRTILGLSQSDFAGLLRVSESMVSMEEFGTRDFPHEAFMKNITWFTLYHQVEAEFPKLDFESALENVLENWKDEGFKELVLKWYRKKENEKGNADFQISKLIRKLDELKPKLEQAWKALHFLDILLPKVEDDWDKKKLEYCRKVNIWNAQKWVLEIKQLEWELNKWQKEAAHLSEWLEKYKFLKKAE